MNIDVKHKETDNKGMFFIEHEGEIISELTYKVKENNVMVINHTETDDAYRGRHLASKLLEHAVAYARDHVMKIDPLCPFAAAKFKNNKAYQELQA